MLRSSNRGLSPIHKQLLYRTYILPIALYSSQLWYFKGMSLLNSLRELKKMQKKVALWITGAFQTSPIWGVEALASLISIQSYINKIIGQLQLHVVLFPKQHAICSLLYNQHSKKTTPHCMVSFSLTPKQ